MAEISYKIDTTPINKVLDALENGRNTKKLMDNIGAAMRRDAKLNFRRESDPDGTPWEPLKKRSGKILSDTRRLRSSIDYRVVGDDQVEIGTNVVYGPAHNFGRKKINLPARRFLGIEDRQQNKINKLLQAWGDELMAGG